MSALGDYIKAFEEPTKAGRLNPRLPVYARVDGRAFHTLVRKCNLPKPDEKFSSIMKTAGLYVTMETKANYVYVQSDEINLFWFPLEREESEFLFDGKLHKLHSVLASSVTACFCFDFFQRFKNPPILPTFDCRVMNLGCKMDIAKAILWRKLDAIKNSVSMVAQNEFSAKELYKKGTRAKVKMLRQKDIDIFEDFDHDILYGWLYKRENVLRTLSKEELEKIPEKHRPEGAVLRTAYKELVDLDYEDFI